MERDIFIPSWKKLTYGQYVFGGIDLSTSAIHSGRIWARLGNNQIIIISRGEQPEEAVIIDNNILNGHSVSRFFSTPYGLVAIGNGTIGLIETSP